LSHNKFGQTAGITLLSLRSATVGEYYYSVTGDDEITPKTTANC